MKLGAFLVIFFCFTAAFSQKEIVVDSLDFSKEKVKEKDSVKKHSVLKAALFSVVLPGAGQVYNHIAMPKGQKKAYWKVPLIYAGLGATGYFIYKNHLTQRDLKAEYLFRQESKFTLKNDERWLEYDANAVLQLYQKHLNQRDLFILGFGLVYLLQVADAAIEAHFVRFDISENLTLQLRPAIIQNPYAMSGNLGINVALKFK